MPVPGVGSKLGYVKFGHPILKTNKSHGGTLYKSIHTFIATSHPLAGAPFYLHCRDKPLIKAALFKGPNCKYVTSYCFKNYLILKWKFPKLKSLLK